MLDDVRAGAYVDDESFDRIYPAAVRACSRRHWTPLRAIVRALEMVGADEETRVVDVGSGAGKFCLVGALVSKATFVGLEQREGLVDVAQAVAREYGVERATYVHAEAEKVDWSGFDACYFYNPFGEFDLALEERIALDARFTPERHRHLLRAVRARLYLAPAGTRVVTYHGLGTRMPPGYRCIEVDEHRGGALECWVRGDPCRAETPPWADSSDCDDLLFGDDLDEPGSR